MECHSRRKDIPPPIRRRCIDTLHEFWEWSEHGQYPIVVDTTSCTHTLRTCKDDLNEEDKELLEKLTILDSIEFLHDFVLPKLKHPGH